MGAGGALDPFDWLEQLDGQRSLQWIQDQNARTIDEFSTSTYRDYESVLLSVYAHNEKTVSVDRYGEYVYAVHRSSDHLKGCWQRTTWQRYRDGKPEWEKLLDIDDLSRAEGRNWVWQTAVMSTVVPGRAMIGLSDGGSDAVAFREFDLESHSFVEDGFNLPVARQVVAWHDRDLLVVLSTLGEGHKTEASYYRTVRLWRRNEVFGDAHIFFEVAASHMRAIAHIDHTIPIPRFFLVDCSTMTSNTFYLGDLSGERRRISLPKNAWMNPRGEFVAIYMPQAWTFAGNFYPAGSILGGRISDLVNETGKFEVLFISEERYSLQKYFWAGNDLVLSILDNLRPSLFKFKVAQNGWIKEKVDTPKDDGAMNVWSVDVPSSEGNGDLFLTVEDPLTSRALFVLENGRAPIALMSGRSLSHANNLAITRHEAISTDGERIPYVQVGPVGLTGNAPVLMYGYGGFGISLSPNFNAAVYRLWLEKGGTYVLTHIRGGGEFGTRWRNEGTRRRKAQSHDDFAAVASDLVTRGVTSPKRIAAEGMSNGGLLIANMLTRYPDRFGALFCSNPLTDMQRFSILGAGAAVIAEYGDPSDVDDQNHLQQISAYHNIRPNQNYPPILFTTSRTDDRVHPAHARKMAARLQEYGYEAWLYETKTGGHSYGNDRNEKATLLALAYSFLWKRVTVDK